MSHLDFKSYPGVGQYNAKHFHYAQTVKVGDVVYISGQVRLSVVHRRLVGRVSSRKLLRMPSLIRQGGWEDGDAVYVWKEGVEAQIRQAFKNVEIALKDAGATMDNVFKVSYFPSPSLPLSSR